MSTKIAAADDTAAACPLIFQNGLTAASMTMPVTMPSTITTTLRGEPTAANTTSPAMTQASAMGSTGPPAAVADVVVSDLAQPHEDEQQEQGQYTDKEGSQCEPMVPGNPGSITGLMTNCSVTTTGSWNASVSHLAARFSARIAAGRAALEFLVK